MSAPDQTIQSAAARFADVLKATYATPIAAQPEDQLKQPVRELLAAAGQAFNLAVDSRTEVSAVGGRPDVGVLVNGLLSGHVELKAPGKGARTERFKTTDRMQWGKFQALPNLLYTDGEEWALYRSGEREGRVVRLGDGLADRGTEALDPDGAKRLADLLRDFLTWDPIVPATPRALAETLAPLCHLLREEVLDSLARDGSPIQQVASEWREILFPDADNAQFADAYAQTVTYTLLLARFEGEEAVELDSAEQALRRRHGLLARALRLLSDPALRDEIRLGVELLERSIGAIDLNALARAGGDPWLYFYEDFLFRYDRKLRNDRGVYYTPVEVIRCQCRLVRDLLRGRFGKDLDFADDEVVLLDPGAGTGAYLLAAFQMGRERITERQGAGAVPGRASLMARNFHAFEILVGPYAVAHLRLTQAIQDGGGEVPEDGVHVYLTDTLESPHAKTLSKLPFLHQALADEHARAQKVKIETRVLVCIGNPPYDRQQIDRDDVKTKRRGGWVRFGEYGGDAILNQFLDPALEAGYGNHLKNVYNDYVYFWRWALWKVFETTGAAGIVSFISASSYLRGPGFVGMRQVMRQTFDELWIVDLEGDNLGARKTENVFAIQTPVAIAVGVRYGQPDPEHPARVRYARIEGTKGEKLAQLDAITGFASLEWRECFKGWMEPFLPEGEGNYFSWPLLTDVFPWQHSGAQFKRTWPIGEAEGVLEKRWRALVHSEPSNRADLFRESRDRKIDRAYPRLDVPESNDTPLVELVDSAACPPVLRYSYRSFDRQWALADSRLGDFLRPALWRIQNAQQVFLTSLLTKVLGLGPAATVASAVPDMDCFSGRGAKDVIPLWREPETQSPNVTFGLLERLGETLARSVTPEDLFAYCYAVLAGPSYVDSFSEELTIPGPRVPITKDPELFFRAAALGRKLVFLHTYGERLGEPGERIPHGQVRCTKAIPATPDGYPETFACDEETRTLRVGAGEFAPVAPEVWGFSVSGLEVVKSWLAYRMKEGAGKRSSPLDKIRPERWTSRMTDELLELLWVLEATVALFPELARTLDEIVASDLFLGAELPKPSDDERKPPKPDDHAGQRKIGEPAT